MTLVMDRPGRLMSVSETEAAVIARAKTETRRLGWWLDKNGRHLVKPGDRLVLCRKVMGRKRADGTVEPLVRLATVEVTSVHREPLDSITVASIEAEGVPYERFMPWVPWHEPLDIAAAADALCTGWVAWFAETMGCKPTDDVTVIRWRYLDWETP